MKRASGHLSTFLRSLNPLSICSTQHTADALSTEVGITLADVAYAETQAGVTLACSSWLREASCRPKALPTHPTDKSGCRWFGAGFTGCSKTNHDEDPKVNYKKVKLAMISTLSMSKFKNHRWMVV